MTDTTPTTAESYPATLAEALLAFQSRMPRIGKTQTANVPTKNGGSYSYQYADLASIQEVALPVLNELGLTFTCVGRLVDGTYGMVGILRHVSGTTDEGFLPIATQNRTPQEVGSGITYARRYLLCAMTGLVTEVDDDGSIASSARERISDEAKAEAEELRAQARLDTARTQAFRRWQAVNPGGDRDGFIGAIAHDFQRPFPQVTAEDLAGWLLNPPPAGGPS